MSSKRRRFAAALGVVGVLAAVWMGLAWRSHRFPFTPPPPPVEVTRAQLELRDGVLFRTGERDAFNGLLIEEWKPGVRKVEIEIARGQAHGRSRGWFENGQLEVEETFQRGVADGVRTRWYESGVKRSEAAIRAGVITGVFREWHENGQLAIEMPMLDGKAHGEVKAWFPSGHPKSVVQMDHGAVVKTERFEDVAR